MKTTAYWLKNKEKILFIIILLLGCILRLYRLPQTMQFLGDQGRDAVIARGILIEHDPAFIGPVTSVGNMYLGPFYYYFMVLPLMFSYPSPVGPAIAVALVGIVTLALIYLLGKQMVGPKVAMLSLFLYAISPIIIDNVRFSWNPNIVPFFSLLLIWSIWKTLGDRPKYWVVVGALTAILIQLHYLTLILVGGAGLIWVREFVLRVSKKKPLREFLMSTAFAVGIVLISFIPLVLFDFKHDFVIAKAFASFFVRIPGVKHESHFRTLANLSAIFYAWVGLMQRTLIELFGKAVPASVAIFSFAIFCYLSLKTFLLGKQGDPSMKGRRLIYFLFVISVCVLAFYKESIFTHYLGFMFPLGVFMLSLFLVRLWESVFLRPLVLGVLAVLIVLSIQQYPGKSNLGLNVFVVRDTALEIEKRTHPGELYDILLLSENNDFLGMNYRYFLNTGAHKPAREDQVFEFKRLFVIDENHQKNPLDTPQYKVAIWPNRTIVDHFSVHNGPDVYVLERD